MEHDLDKYEKHGYSAGRHFVVQTLWYIVSAAIFQTQLFPCSAIKVWLLRRFGASIGNGVVIKPSVRIKFPWRLQVGDHSWIGESVWIDNLANVSIGSHVCISQLTYLCTGSHDYRKKSFDLITRPIKICDHAWICARATVLPGVTIGSQSVISAGAVVGRDVDANVIVMSSPGQIVRVQAAERT